MWKKDAKKVPYVQQNSLYYYIGGKIALSDPANWKKKTQKNGPVQNSVYYYIGYICCYKSITLNMNVARICIKIGYIMIQD